MKRSVGVLDFPDNDAELAPWLERKLVGIDLARLIADLEAVHGASSVAPSPDLETILGSRLEDVLHNGLGVLPRSTLRALLRQPRRLLDLQERLLMADNPYWHSLNCADPEVGRHVQTSRNALDSLGKDAPVTKRDVIPFPDMHSLRSGRGVRIWAVVATLVASVLAAMVTIDRVGPSRPPADPLAWGWSRPDAFAPAGSRQAYLERLATEAKEWFRVRPSGDDPQTFALRLGEFRASCSRLILAQHTSLPKADRDWLIERCRKWSESLDGVRNSLEQGGSLDKARANADAIVDKLVNALGDRARTPA